MVNIKIAICYTAISCSIVLMPQINVKSDYSVILSTNIVERQIKATDEEIRLLERVVMSEASTESYECKVAVAETVINRFLKWDYESIVEVIEEENAFSTQDNGEPNEDCIKAVTQALEYSEYDENMVYFRSGKYHSYGTEYMQIGNMFFNVEGE